MAMNSAAGSGGPLLKPEEVGRLLIQPMFDASVCAQAAQRVVTDSASYRIPMITDDPRAGWVNEGDEITVTDPTLSETTVTPAKLAGLTIVSSELAEDASEPATEAVGQALSRDLARKADEAFFGALAAPAPPGLESLDGVSTVDAGPSWTNLDSFAGALAAAENEHATLSNFVAHPDDALKLATLKHDADESSNVPLLGPGDATQENQRRILGVPLLVSPAVTPGTIWGLPQDRAVLVVRRDAKIDVDFSTFFTSDRAAIRATTRMAFGFPHPAAVVKVSLSGA